MAKATLYSAVSGWLYVVAFLVALMGLVGGATRLTESGLAITETGCRHHPSAKCFRLADRI